MDTCTWLTLNACVCLSLSGFDFRIPVTTDLDKFRKQLEQWCEGDGVKFELIHGTDFG